MCEVAIFVSPFFVRTHSAIGHAELIGYQGGMTQVLATLHIIRVHATRERDFVDSKLFLFASFSYMQVDGTSCSSPIVASMVALLNGSSLFDLLRRTIIRFVAFLKLFALFQSTLKTKGNRLNAKKKPLGYLNPMLYAAHAKNAAIFKDITIGER